MELCMVTLLQKGTNVSLGTIAPQLNEVVIVVKWKKKPDDATEFEIDASAFLLTQENQVRSNADFICYKQPKTINNSVILKEHLFKVCINHVAEDVSKISFVLTLRDANQKQQFFGMLENLTIELFNFTSKQKLASYTEKDITLETSVILAQLYRYNTEWKFKAVGQGYIDGLYVLAKNYGLILCTDNIEKKQAINLKSDEHNKKPLNALKNTSDAVIEHKTKSLPSKKIKLQKKEDIKNAVSNKNQNTDFDIHNTNIMSKQESYKPIVQWLKLKNFEAEVNEEAMDTSGFFDEIAVALGDNYALLQVIHNTIKRRQLKGYDKAYIDLSSYKSQDIELIKKFCKELYNCAFVAKYFYNNNDKKVILHLQSATKIINFFNGEWLEWYAFMKIATLCYENQITFSCTRNMIIYLPDEHKYEIDVFFLINDTPLFVECKSGEYREFIDKYSRLRRKMFIKKPYFLFLTLGVETESVKGLTAMFDITFVNEKTLVNYIKQTFFADEAEQ